MLELLLSKYAMAILGPLILGIIIFYKGYKSGSDSVRYREKDELDKFQSKIRAAEAKNLWLEKEKEKKENEVRDSRTISDLIGVWNKIQSKDSSRPSDKSPK